MKSTAAVKSTFKVSPFWLVIAASVWMATATNLALWQTLSQLGQLSNPAGWAWVAGLALIIATALCVLLSALAWRATLKPALSVLLLASALGAHFMQSYNLVIDATMMVNVLQSDPREAADLLTPRLFMMLLVLGVLPTWLVWCMPVRYARAPRQLLHNLLQAGGAILVLVLVTLAVFQPLASTMRNYKHVRYLINPLNSVYALGYLVTHSLQQRNSMIEPIGLDAQSPAPSAGQRPPLLVLVLGETARSGNFGLNGYARATTPELAQTNVVSFTNAWSCGTSTAASVPCMFSHIGSRDRFNSRPNDYEGLLDVLQRAGLAVLWLDNQAGCKGTCDRVPHVSTSALTDPELCPGGECFDAIMLKGLEGRVAALPAAQRARGVVLVMHQMGSHGPAYAKRSPPAFKRFMPECTSSDLQNCSHDELINAYDNSIAYTDHFLASTIRWLQTQQASFDPAMVYLSDHGESLGENKLYLHGLPYLIAPDVQKRVPWITWLSSGLSQRTGLKPQCLEQQRDVHISHENYFHSVLGLLGIQTRVYQRALDVYASCMRPEARAL